MVFNPLLKNMKVNGFRMTSHIITMEHKTHIEKMFETTNQYIYIILYNYKCLYPDKDCHPNISSEILPSPGAEKQPHSLVPLGDHLVPKMGPSPTKMGFP